MDLKNVHVRIPFKQLDAFLPIVEKKEVGVELFISSYFLDRTPLKQLKPLKKYLNTGKTLSWHAPFSNLSPGGADEKVRNLSVERIIQTAQFAEYFSPQVLVAHTGFDLFAYSGHTDYWLKNSIESWKKVLYECPNIRIAIENVFETSPFLLLKLIEAVDSPRFGFCFDVGHFNIFSDVNLSEWFKRLGKYLFEVHLHDNNGDEDEHLGAGQGTFEFSTFFPLLFSLPQSPVLAIESHNEKGIHESLAFLEHIQP